MTKGLSLTDIEAIDLSAERAWPPARVIDIDGWHCRMDRGVTRRANSILAHGGAEDLKKRLDKVTNFYGAADLRPCFQITPATNPSALEPLLDERGFGCEGESLVLRLDAATPGRASGAYDDVGLMAGPSDEWLREFLVGWPADKSQIRCNILKRIRVPHVYAFIGPVTAPSSKAMAVCDGKRGWINSMYTDQNERRKGLGRRVLMSLLHWLSGQGATQIYLQVEADNTPARRLYESCGFRVLYPYHYRVLHRGTLCVANVV